MILNFEAATMITEILFIENEDSIRFATVLSIQFGIF